MQDQLEKREGHFFYKGKKLIVDRITSADFYYEVLGNKVEGKLRMGGKEVPLSACEAVFPGWFLYGGVLRQLPDEVDHEWVVLVYPFPKEINDPQFFKTLEKERRSMPAVIWKEKPIVPSMEARPYLVLKDRSGAFADLWMDYGEGRSIAFHDEKVVAWRSLEVERHWEKDLLDTGFQRKWRENSRYYCPLDQVTKTLTFLLELGWKIKDYQNKEVYRQAAKDLQLYMDNDRIFLKGTIAYSEHLADINGVLGSFNRREQFISLSDEAVGLIDPDVNWADLPFKDGQVCVKKTHVGLLESFFSDKQLKVTPNVQELIDRIYRSPGIVAVSPGAAFQGNLYPYQQEGLNWLHFLYESGFSGLLADEMGLGKTVQILALLSLISFQEPLLIVVPTSLLFNWKREFEKFLPTFDAYLYTGKGRLQDKEVLAKKQVVIISYALLRLDAHFLQSVRWSAIILDEAQAIKNADSQIAQVACGFNVPFKLAITGTPIENRWEDLESLFTFLMPELISAQTLMKRKIRPFLLRRQKDQVALDLPEKIEQTVYVEMDSHQQSLYDEIVIRSKHKLQPKIESEGINAHRMEILEAILRLRQVCCHPYLLGNDGESAKFTQLMEDLQEVMASGRKVLVYSQFTTMLRLIEKGVQERGWNYAYLDGSVRDREGEVRKFQDGDASIFLISLKAGGVGLNLSAADYVFLYDPWWNEAVEAQAIDRAHRHGRKDRVIAKRYITMGSLEEKMMHLKSYKSSLSRDLFSEEDASFSLDDLYEMLT